jgi:hypothetical protein
VGEEGCFEGAHALFVGAFGHRGWVEPCNEGRALLHFKQKWVVVVWWHMLYLQSSVVITV